MRRDGTEVELLGTEEDRGEQQSGRSYKEEGEMLGLSSGTSDTQ